LDGGVIETKGSEQLSEGLVRLNYLDQAGVVQRAIEVPIPQDSLFGVISTMLLDPTEEMVVKELSISSDLFTLGY
jgi:hypothetical protein